MIFYIAIIAATLGYLGFDMRDDLSRLRPLLGLLTFLLLGFAFSAQRAFVSSSFKTTLWKIVDAFGIYV